MPAWLLRRAALLATVAIVACTPALNWREIRLDRLTALLPCKPDHAQRPVRLGPTDLQLEMAGCEAAGALFAISHVRVPDPQQLTAAETEWQKAALATMQATNVRHETFKLEKPADNVVQVREAKSGLLPDGMLELLVAEGRRADGTPVQARLAWFAQGADVFHVAVYGAALNVDTYQMFFSGLKLQ
jgi:hypothetical protein